jgi:redox-sensing transcriptional repressor
MKSISKAVISRLPRYYRYLGDLLSEGVDKISSRELSELMHVTASQIRQDLSNFGVFGQQGYGYNVSFLYEEIGKILNLNKKHNMIIIGVGNLGRAIANYSDFEKRGFVITGIFDSSKELIGENINGLLIRDFNEVRDFIKNNKVDIATITVPRDYAVEVATILVNAGIKAIWNFAPVDLKLPDDIVVENVHLTASLMQLSYNLARVDVK